MFDPMMRRLIDPPLARMATSLAARSISANAITATGFVLGLLAMLSVYMGAFWLALILLLAGRLADGLDGAVARIHGATDLGGYLDITLDFIFYSGFVFAFALFDPQNNALPSSFLIFSFVGNGCSFLALAIMAAKRKISTERRGKKSFYFSGGITEGTETIIFFVFFCLFPSEFHILAWIFGMLCWITTAGRTVQAFKLLKD